MEVTGEIKEKAARVRLLAMDCDGVLTDGRLYYGENGEAFKAFHVHDGQGIVAWHRAGFVSAVVTARSSEMLARRGDELGIKHVIQNVKDKASVILSICEEEGIDPGETAFVGDDIADIGAMRSVGLPIAVANAAQEVKVTAALLTSKDGGEGAVREVSDMLLLARQ